ncbi:DUF3617 domain-containing protein [Roseovarius aestuarii]|uniref:DUF3617 family protein n=1 Tax=Roseovarius aestuarii TaxID=475083 RepID=A0A1X7BRH9_9RHOB|nr:DUF3617 family protein [Roseovarius aestuarii]SMC12242.1 hypothetical protein ROA7745_02065 [Roseovarius aestuarii]
MSRLIYGVMLAFSVACVSPAIAERTISVKPGLWEYTHSLEIPGLVSPLEKPKTECINAEESERNLSDLLGKLSKDAGCTVTNLKSSLSTVNFDLVCTRDVASASLQSTGHLAFRYGREEITGTADGTISLNGVELPVQATGMARHIGRCKN